MMGDRPMHGHISNLPSGEAIHPAPMGPERQIPTIWRSECSVCIDTAIAAVKLYDGEVSAGWRMARLAFPALDLKFGIQGPLKMYAHDTIVRE